MTVWSTWLPRGGENGGVKLKKKKALYKLFGKTPWGFGKNSLTNACWYLTRLGHVSGLKLKLHESQCMQSKIISEMKKGPVWSSVSSADGKDSGHVIRPGWAAWCPALLIGQACVMSAPVALGGLRCRRAMCLGDGRQLHTAERIADCLKVLCFLLCIWGI